jgi:hypothetical protein
MPTFDVVVDDGVHADADAAKEPYFWDYSPVEGS